MTKIISDSSPVRELNVNESRNYQRLCITYISNRAKFCQTARNDYF